MSIIGMIPVAVVAADEECPTTNNGLFKSRRCERFGLDSDGRLLSCLPSENCVSTSAISVPSQYGAPWSFGSRDPKDAFQDLLKALEAQGLTIIETKDFYVHATAPSTVQGYVTNDVDDVEFRIDPKDNLCFYRSASRESVFFFPAQNLYQLPLGDGNTNRNRLETLRTALGWDTLAVLEKPQYLQGDDFQLDNPSDYQPLRE